MAARLDNAHAIHAIKSSLSLVAQMANMASDCKSITFETRISDEPFRFALLFYIAVCVVYSVGQDAKFHVVRCFVSSTLAVSSGRSQTIHKYLPHPLYYPSLSLAHFMARNTEPFYRHLDRRSFSIPPYWLCTLNELQLLIIPNPDAGTYALLLFARMWQRESRYEATGYLIIDWMRNVHRLKSNQRIRLLYLATLDRNWSRPYTLSLSFTSSATPK